MSGCVIPVFIKNNWTIRIWKSRREAEILFEYKLGMPGGFTFDLGLTRRIIGLAIKDDSIHSLAGNHFYHWTVILGFITVGIRLWLKRNPLNKK